MKYFLSVLLVFVSPFIFAGEVPTAEVKQPLIEDDKVVFGLLMVLLAVIFYASSLQKGFWKKFFTFIPALFLCYFLPSLLTTANIISPDSSNLYTMAKNYLLPASLLLMTLSIDIKGVFRLGPKSLIMFFTATVGIIIGGPLAIIIMKSFSPETVGGVGDAATWRGLSTLAGSWIGGGANQAAMLEVYEYKKDLFAGMVTVDIVVANIWMAVLLFMVGRSKKVDKWLKADSKAIDDLIQRMEKFEKSVSRMPALKDYIIIAGVAFGGVAFSHFVASELSTYFATMTDNPDEFVLASSFFWLVVTATLIGFLLSFTRMRELEGVGASKMGSVFIYILVATIGMKMDITKIMENPLLIFVGLIWMAIHVILLFTVAKIIKAPFFFLAVGSKANIGGAASAPVVASAFHPALTTVGVLLAVLGYFMGTIGAILCAEMMSAVAP